MSRVRTITYSITEDFVTIKHFLRFRRYPRKLRAQLKECSSQVLLNGVAQPLWRPLHKGDVLKITILEDQDPSLQLRPVFKPLDIVFEDEDILVIDKPVGMSIHPSFNHYEDSLANVVLGYFMGKGEEIVFRCVNRLDRETSGLTIIAKNRLAGAILSIDVKERRIHREYRAVVKGSLPVDGMWHIIDVPIGRLPNSAIMRQVDILEGKPAVTWYQTLDHDEKYSFVKLRLETGRTHQIRVHMNYIGHPLPGDYLYHPDFSDFCRVPLHSHLLEFVHPITGENLRFESSVPEDMRLP